MTLLLRCLLLLVLIWPAAARAQAEPAQVVENFHAALLAAMQQGPGLGFAGRMALLEPVVAETFAFPAMTRVVLGSRAATLAPDQMRAVQQTFQRFSAASYASQFRKYDGERFEAEAPRPAPGGTVLVPTRIVGRDESYRLDYLLRQEDGQWRVVDVLADGSISQVAVRRSEFQSILRRDGVDGLLRRLEEQTQALAARP